MSGFWRRAANAGTRHALVSFALAAALSGGCERGSGGDGDGQQKPSAESSDKRDKQKTASTQPATQPTFAPGVRGELERTIHVAREAVAADDLDALMQVWIQPKQFRRPLIEQDWEKVKAELAKLLPPPDEREHRQVETHANQAAYLFTQVVERDTRLVRVVFTKDGEAWKIDGAAFRVKTFRTPLTDELVESAIARLLEQPDMKFRASRRPAPAPERRGR